MNALRRPEVRGQWGEMTLRRLAELAGMVEHCDFNEQVHVRTEDGALRPDMIVHMPDGRDLVVDVKTPLDAYLDAVDATTMRRAPRRCAVTRRPSPSACGSSAPRTTGASSSTARISSSCSSPAISSCPRRWPSCRSCSKTRIRQNVIIATPTSFVALLKAVAYGWRQKALAQNAETDPQARRGPVQAPGRVHRPPREARPQPRQQRRSLQRAVGSLERQVLPGARKFTELGVRPDREIEALDPIDKLRASRSGARTRPVRAMPEPPPAKQSDESQG